MEKDQIEEMAIGLEEEFALCGTLSSCGTKRCSRCFSKYLYEQGYRKVPENAVILTPEERDEEMKEIDKAFAECDELQELNIKYYNEAKDLRRKVADIEAENERLSAKLGQILLSIDTVKEMNTMRNIDDYRKQAVQEFAEKLKKRLMQDRVINDNVVIVTGVEIDELLKEYEE